MKRVLNSGSIKLPYVVGTEKELLSNALAAYGEQDLIPWVLKTNVLAHITFTFEVKAPLLTFNDFQEAHLGTLKALEADEHHMMYLPAQFWKQDGLMLNIMSTKDCNEHNTKLYNFYSAALNFYNKLVAGGLCESQARLVLPQGLFVSFLFTITAKDLIEFIRKNKSVSPEMSGYCSVFMLYLQEHLPLVIGWLQKNDPIL